MYDGLLGLTNYFKTPYFMISTVIALIVSYVAIYKMGDK